MGKSVLSALWELGQLKVILYCYTGSSRPGLHEILSQKQEEKSSVISKGQQVSQVVIAEVPQAERYDEQTLMPSSSGHWYMTSGG